MERITVSAPAKINLALYITGKRPDGYHTLDTVFQTISIADTVTIEKESPVSSDPSISLTTDSLIIPTDEKNIAYKAAELFLKKTGIRDSVSIHIEKRIPMEAGLGGGSADAAAVLYGLNLLNKTPLTLSALSDIALQIGADVPFLLRGGTAVGKGIGEELYSFSVKQHFSLLLAKPDFGLSAQEVYKKWDTLGCNISQDSELKNTESLTELKNTELLTELLKRDNSDWEGYRRLMVNDMEDAAFSLKPALFDLKKDFIREGAEVSLMSGSGSTVFGIFSSEEKREMAKETLIARYPDYTFIEAENTDHGVQVQ